MFSEQIAQFQIILLRQTRFCRLQGPIGASLSKFPYIQWNIYLRRELLDST